MKNLNRIIKSKFQVQIRLVRNYEIQIHSQSIKKLQIRRIYIQIHVHLCLHTCCGDFHDKCIETCALQCGFL